MFTITVAYRDRRTLFDKLCVQIEPASAATAAKELSRVYGDDFVVNVTGSARIWLIYESGELKKKRTWDMFYLDATDSEGSAAQTEVAVMLAGV